MDGAQKELVPLSSWDLTYSLPPILLAAERRCSKIIDSSLQRSFALVDDRLHCDDNAARRPWYLHSQVLWLLLVQTHSYFILLVVKVILLAHVVQYSSSFSGPIALLRIEVRQYHTFSLSPLTIRQP